MREYQIEFDKLANHIKGFSDAFYMSCFISGLKDAIRSEVKLLFPRTMMESLGLAKLEKENIIAQQHSKSTFVPFINMVSQRPPIVPTPITSPIKNLSGDEMWACRVKGFC